MIHTVKGFGIVNKAEIDVFLELSCFFEDPADVGNLISAFSKTSLNIWEFTVHVLLIPWPLGSSNKICLWGINQDPKDYKEPPLYAPGTQVLIKVWKDGSPKTQLQPTWKGPYPVILSTSTAVKVPGHDSWIHCSQSCERKQKRTLYTPVSPWRSQISIQDYKWVSFIWTSPKLSFWG